MAPAALGLLLLAAPVFAQPRFDFEATPTRLPKAVVPVHVQLALDVDPARDDFTGRVAIQLRVREPVAAIVLHARELVADGGAELTPAAAAAGTSPRALDVLSDERAQTWRLAPSDGGIIAAGNWSLFVRYRGRVQTAGEGLYRADYRSRGEPARMLATQLEAVHARRLMPCFDEPVFRAVFEVAVRAPRGLQVLSNMPRVESRADGDAAEIHRYAPTPPMPSYLLAVAVGRFDALEGVVDGIPLRVVTAAGKRDQGQMALDIARQVLPYYASYFGRAYALPKLDLLAVPGTREGAMEDWGLISFVESTLLFDPAASDEMTRRTVFTLVAHEIAHQWFGNLVSVASWDEIWLNEAFATWLEQKATAHFHPEWQSVLRVRRGVEATMARDATAATRAIRSGPVSEASVFEVFDGITYEKGAGVLSMIEQWVGPAAFQRGLAAYVADRAFKPATAGDLWHHIGLASGQPVAQVAANWTDQPGLPLLQATQRCDAGRTRVALRQSRYAAGDPLPGGPWRIPLRIARGGDEQTLLMDRPQADVEWPGCDPALPVVVGSGGGWYRVAYEAPMRERVGTALAALPPLDRVAVVSDSHALARDGRLPMRDHLALLGALGAVDDASRAALWAMALAQWRAFDVALDATPAQPPLRAAALRLFAPELDRLGWRARPGDDGELLSLRADLVRALARFGHAPTRAAAHDRFAAALAGEGVEPSLRPAVLFAVGTDPTDAEFDAMLATLIRSESHEQRWRLVQALTAGRDARRAGRLLEMPLLRRLPPDIGVGLVEGFGAEPALSPLTYAFVTDHWSELAAMAGDGGFGARYWLLPSAAAGSSDAAVARRLVDDQRRHAGAAGDSAAATVAAAIDVRSRLRERESRAFAGGTAPGARAPTTTPLQPARPAAPLPAHPAPAP